MFMEYFDALRPLAFNPAEEKKCWGGGGGCKYLFNEFWKDILYV